MGNEGKYAKRERKASRWQSFFVLIFLLGDLFVPHVPQWFRLSSFCAGMLAWLVWFYFVVRRSQSGDEY
jgi:hypothetical protein